MKAPSPVSPFYQPSTPATRYFALLYKSAFLFFLIHLHLHFTTSLHRAGGVIGAFLFVVIETSWLTITKEDDAGVVTICWTGTLGHSSFAQFWSNVIFCPLILFFYRFLLPSHPLWRILLFPLNIWALEIIEGYVIMFLFGKNVAWEYRGKDAFLHGNIKLSYALPWIFLGVVVEVAWDIVLLPLSIALDESGYVRNLLTVAGIVTLLFSPRMGAMGLWKSMRGIKQD